MDAAKTLIQIYQRKRRHADINDTNSMLSNSSLEVHDSIPNEHENVSFLHVSVDNNPLKSPSETQDDESSTSILEDSISTEAPRVTTQDSPKVFKDSQHLDLHITTKSYEDLIQNKSEDSISTEESQFDKDKDNLSAMAQMGFNKDISSNKTQDILEDLSASFSSKLDEQPLGASQTTLESEESSGEIEAKDSPSEKKLPSAKDLSLSSTKVATDISETNLDSEESEEVEDLSVIPRAKLVSDKDPSTRPSSKDASVSEMNLDERENVSEEMEELSEVPNSKFVSDKDSSLQMSIGGMKMEDNLQDEPENLSDIPKSSLVHENEKVIEENTTSIEDVATKETESNEKTENESLQQDFPIYAYGSEEFEVVNLNETTETKKKSPDSNQLDNDVHGLNLQKVKNKTMEESSEELQTLNVTPVKKQLVEEKKSLHASDLTPSVSNNPQVHLVDIPEKSHSRVLVNVTIATDSNSPFASKPFYVLSVSVPTDGDPNNFPGINIGLPNKQELIQMEHSSPQYVTSTQPTAPQWGGQCECSCPCLDDNISKEDETNSSTSDTTTENTISTQTENSDMENSTSTTESDIFSEDPTSSTTELSACPEFSTPLPPVPTILILEGRRMSK